MDVLGRPIQAVPQAGAGRIKACSGLPCGLQAQRKACHAGLVAAGGVPGAKYEKNFSRCGQEICSAGKPRDALGWAQQVGVRSGPAAAGAGPLA